MLSLPTDPQLLPLPNGNTLHLFPSDALDILRLDFTFEAGAAYQQKKFCAVAANTLFPVASAGRPFHEVAEFFDFRGIVVEPFVDTSTSALTVYTLPRYVDDLLPLLQELLLQPSFPDDEFESFARKTQARLKSSFQKTRYVVRNLFFESLFGSEHPLGRYAVPEDIPLLTVDDVKAFHRQHYHLSDAHLVMSGNYDDRILKLYADHFAPVGDGPRKTPCSLAAPSPYVGEQKIRRAFPGAVQASICIGSVLPLSWDDPDYARFIVLNTVLGGYFGSRLMSNLREDKGFTYGIYSQTHIYRGCIVFSIAADVSSQSVQEAVAEIYNELRRLQEELVPNDELEVVRHYMEGDYLRSIDGLFERAERFRQMCSNFVSDQFSLNLFDAIQNVTPEQLQQLARRYFNPDLLVEAVVG